MSARICAKGICRAQPLIALTDGKPNDLDHYEGQHGIEDSHGCDAKRGGRANLASTTSTKTGKIGSHALWTRYYCPTPHAPHPRVARYLPTPTSGDMT
jgi:hypothetical protein